MGRRGKKGFVKRRKTTCHCYKPSGLLLAIAMAMAMAWLGGYRATPKIGYCKVLQRVFKNRSYVIIIFRKYFKYLFVLLQTNKLTFHSQWMCQNKAEPRKEERCCTSQYDSTVWQSSHFRFQHDLQKALTSFLEMQK